ncbi:hypothetical protein I7I51_06227 [Histoplasma capsulatum]|uniref:Uncharacterized protein n=1 Tax=Ajellomyces capsulatus TaxID=5037 RepID=A0A8A1MHN2_AJECA|nr:hypothetical protein I7I51_06227 [Histoplasma capsulatum]
MIEKRKYGQIMSDQRRTWHCCEQKSKSIHPNPSIDKKKLYLLLAIGGALAAGMEELIVRSCDKFRTKQEEGRRKGGLATPVYTTSVNVPRAAVNPSSWWRGGREKRSRQYRAGPLTLAYTEHGTRQYGLLQFVLLLRTLALGSVVLCRMGRGDGLHSTWGLNRGNPRLSSAHDVSVPYKQTGWKNYQGKRKGKMFPESRDRIIHFPRTRTEVLGTKTFWTQESIMKTWWPSTARCMAGGTSVLAPDAAEDIQTLCMY